MILIKSEEIKISVVIPTKNRPVKLRKSLNSVISQTRLPQKIIIINDSDNKFIQMTNNVIQKYSSPIIVSTKNTRSRNLSGAVNTGLEYVDDNPTSYIALLDDDDWWDETYLETIEEEIRQNLVEWVISGLIRYDEINPYGIRQPIPKNISIDNFLISNPNIQGSNIFVSARAIKKIGGFDEYLPSTTDRDLCIRLLQNNTSYSMVNRHLVHHWAMDDYIRLSTPGSILKKQGTKRFYEKYKYLMSDKQKAEFKQRAANLFRVYID